MKKIALVTIVALLSYLKPYCQDSLFVGKSFAGIATYKKDGSFSNRSCDKTTVFDFVSLGKGVAYNLDKNKNISKSIPFSWIVSKNTINFFFDGNPKMTCSYKFLNSWLLQTIDETGDYDLYIKR